ncbi:MAG: electron transport complex subunit RsxG [Thiomargarita sp.]|nr:electron transport complex subunit RsxG [Thiomargarita sp.]
MLVKKMIQMAILLAFFAILGGGLVAFTFQITYEQIKANERAALLQTLSSLVPRDQYDNDLFEDIHYMRNETLLGSDKPIVIYRARKQGQPVAAVLNSVAPNGYNGAINLLIGISYEGVLMGVRVVSHQETPGLSDSIDERRSDWILGFNGHSLQNLEEKDWRVKRDGGVFDQFTGATITPRAVVSAVYNTLQFFQQHRDEIFLNAN